MKKILDTVVPITILAVLAVVVVMTLTGWKPPIKMIGEGPVQDFTLVSAPVDKYDEIKVEITADQVSGVMAPTVVWQGTIPEDALFYQAMLVDNDRAYDLTLTVREDGIGCLPTNYPNELTMKVYGRMY